MITGYGDRVVSLNDQMHEEHWKELENWIDRLEEKMNADKFSVDPKEWEATLSDYNSEEMGGKYLFPETGLTRVRLVLSPEREATQFYQPVATEFEGKINTRMMFPCLVADARGNYTYEIKFAVVAKSVVQKILKILAMGEYDFLHPENGHAITINRTGSGLGTKYDVTPSKDPVYVDYLALEWPQTLTEVAVEFVTPSEPVEEDEVPF